MGDSCVGRPLLETTLLLHAEREVEPGHGLGVAITARLARFDPHFTAPNEGFSSLCLLGLQTGEYIEVAVAGGLSGMTNLVLDSF